MPERALGEPAEAPLDSHSLAGRRALVTGATSDIGAATVLALARRGADLVLHGHRNAERAGALADECRRLGRRADAVLGDLSVEAEVRRVAADAEALGAVDILVNNAGNVIRRTHWRDLDAALLDRVFGLNYRAPLYLAQLLTPGMAARGRGVIVNVLSTAANLGGSETAFAYASAKGALQTLTRGLARALAPEGIRVLAVSPGTIDTNFQRTGTSQELMAQQRAAVPLGRIGRPEEIGDVVAFLVTDAASFVVGDTIHANGGIYMT